MDLQPYEGKVVTATDNGLQPYTGEVQSLEPAPPSRLRRFVADPAISAVKGAIGLPEAALGIADIATGGRAGKAAEAVGFRPREAKATLDTLYSPEQQQANVEVAQAEGFVPTLRASLRKPSTIAHTVIESAPSMLGGAGVARKLVQKGLTPLVAAAAGEGAVSAGSTAEQVRQESAAGTITAKQAALAAGSGAVTGALNIGGGRLAKRLGIVDIDTMLAGGEKVGKRGIAKAVAGGVAAEGVLEEMPQSAQETAAKNLATGKPIGEGVAASAAQGLVTGAAMGGGFNAASAAVGIGQRAAERKAKLAELELLTPEEQIPAVQELAAQVHAEDPVAASAFEAQVLDRLDAGESALDAETQAVIDERPAVTREALLEAVQESLAVEENPLEILAAKEEAQVAEALKPALVAEEVADPALLRAQGWIAAGRTVLKEGLVPNAEVAAHLDDLGYTLTKGVRSDRTSGGNIPRREWLVEKKVIPLAAPVDLTSAEALAMVEGKTDKPRGVDPASFINANSAYQLRDIPLKQFNWDTEEQGIDPSGRYDGTVDMERAAAYAAQDGASAPPIIAGNSRNVDGLYSVVDGGHRITAAKLRGDASIKALVRVREAKSASVKMMITADETQQLYDRGYKKAQVDRMKPAEAAQILANPPAYAPLQSGEQRLAYEDNPNIVIKRFENKIAVADKKSQEILGVAHLKDGKVGGWVEGKEPATAEERSQIKRAMNEHMGIDAPRFSKVASFADAGIPKSIVGAIKSMMAQGVEVGRQKLAESITNAELAKVPAATWKAVGAQESIDAEVARMAAKVADPETPQYIRTNLSDPATIQRRIDSIKRTHLAFYVAQGVQETRFDKGSGKGLPKADIEAYLAPVIKALKVPVTVVSTAGEVPGLKTDVQFNGVFHQGGIYLNAENITSLEEAEIVLLRHEIRHAGLRSILGKEGLDKVLAKAWGDLKSGVREFAIAKGIDTRTRDGKLEAAEEYIVELARTDAKSPLWDRFVEVFKAALRKLGVNLKFTDTELRSLVARAGEAMLVDGETRFSAAWHGGPHDFDKFSTDKIGTGEGAQAYGYGLYFAGSKKVAEWYKEKLSAGADTGAPQEASEIFMSNIIEAQAEANPRGVREFIADEILAAEAGGNQDTVKFYEHLKARPDFIRKAIQYIKESDRGAYTRAPHAKALDAMIIAAHKAMFRSSGRLYQVDLAPSEDEYLLWDKPLSEQSEKVRDILKSNKPANMPEGSSLDNWKGKTLYASAVGDTGSDKAASEYLYSLGIRGIKYLDGSSRGQGDGNYNYVIFNDEDVEIKAKFSRTATDPKPLIAKTSAQIAKRALGDVTGNIWAAIMPIDRTIKMAQSMPLYAPIKTLLGEYLIHKRAKAAATDVPPTYAQGIRLEHEKAFKTDADLKTFNDLTIKATLYEQHANGRDAGWTEKSWEDSGKLAETGKTLGQVRSEIRKLWVALSLEQQRVQQKMVDHMKVLAQQFREAQLEPLRAFFGDKLFDLAEGLSTQIWKQDAAGIGKMYETHGADAMDLAMQIAEINSDRGQLKGDYAPLMRFGDHVVRTMAVGTEARVKTEIFESKQDALNAVDRIKEEDGVYPEYELQTDGERSVTNIPLAFLEKMKAAAKDRGLTGEALDALMDDFKAARVQTMPRSTVSGNGLRREGVDGYSTDMLRGYATYVAKSARAIASLKYGTAIEQTFRDMTNAVKAYQDPGKKWDAHAVERMSSLRANLYKLEMQHSTEKINELTKALGKTTFLWYLSSPSIWAVQWSQPFMTTIPKMAARYGFTRAFGAYVAEAKNYMAGNFSDEKIEAFSAGHENAGERLYDLIQEERRALPAEKAKLRKSMQALYNGFSTADQKLLILKVLGLQGMLDLSSSHALQDLIGGASDGQVLMDKIVTKGAFFMQKSETGSRRAAAVSSFQLALAGGKDFMEANDYASNIIDDTLADFSAQNRPALLRGNVGRVIGQFQFFRLHMLGKIVQLSKDAYGEKGWGEARKELAYMTGMSLGLAGAAGTPVALLVSNTATNAIWAGLALAFGDEDDPWDPKQDFENMVREAAGDTAGNVFLKGLPSLFGADVSKRIGLGGMANVISGEPPPGLSGTQKAQWYAGRVLGPSFGIVSDSMRAVDALGDGDYAQAVAVSSPKVLKDFIKAYALNERGAVGGGGNTLIQPEDISPASIALQLLGINPMEVALAQEERREIAGLSTHLRQRRSLLLKRVAESTIDGDMDAREEALQGINDWGQKQPGLKITQAELLAAVKRGRAARAGVLSKREQMIQGMVRGE